MNSQTFRIPIKAWFGDEEIDLKFPRDWDVQQYLMAGHENPAITDNQIRHALQHPIDAEPLQKLARGKKKIVILFDDLTRPTPSARVIPFVIEEITRAGIKDDQIRFISALGNHALMSQEDFLKKLGYDVIKRFCIYNHNTFEHLVDLGKTSNGTPILINQEVMDCDLKIGVGGLFPHHTLGFSGGAKIVLPGVSGKDTIHHNHNLNKSMRGNRPGQKIRKFSLSTLEENIIRLDMEEAVRKVGLDFKIDMLINSRREVTDVFAGDFVKEHRKGVEKAEKHYATPIAKDCDIVIANTYPIENQLGKGLWPARFCLKEGGIAVAIAESVEGQVSHYLYGQFGTGYGGVLWGLPGETPVPNAQHLYIHASCESRMDIALYGSSKKITSCASWEQILSHLSSAYPDKAKVALYPYASIQFPKEVNPDGNCGINFK